MKCHNTDLLCTVLIFSINYWMFFNIICFLFPAYELWFKQILFELDSVRDIFISGHVSHMFEVKRLMFYGYSK